MKLMTKIFAPVGTAIWVAYNPEDAMAPGSKLILPGNARMPPFVECEVLEVGKECKEVKKGDRVILNSSPSALTPVKLAGDSSTYFFAKEAMVVALIKGME